MKNVTLRRWQVVAAFALVTAAFVVGLVIATSASRKADRTANVARQLAVSNRKILRQQEQDRQRRRQDNRATLLAICEKQNDSNSILADLLTKVSQLPSQPPTTPQQADARSRILRIFARELRRLKPRDCHALPGVKP